VEKEASMAIQTQQLSEALPQFAAIYRLADAKGTYEWRVVWWRETDPAHVTPDMVTPAEALMDEGQNRPNCFSSRTQALRFSKVNVKREHPHAKETGHWGVWEWVEAGVKRYQSVVPIETPASPAQAVVVREKRAETYSPLVRVSEETNRRLREMAAEDRTTLQSVLDAAVKEHYRHWFFNRADAAYQALRQDETAWEELLEERRSWDAVLLDGIEIEETWQGDGTVRRTTGREPKHA
jgi:hypothetical protein